MSGVAGHGLVELSKGHGRRKKEVGPVLLDWPYVLSESPHTRKIVFIFAKHGTNVAKDLS